MSRPRSSTVASALLSVLVGATVFCPSPVRAGRRFTATQRRLSRVPLLRSVFPPSKGPQLLPVEPHEMSLIVPNQPIWAAFGKNDARGDARTLSYALGRSLARAGFMLATGGGKGLPKDAEDGAYAAGGSTIAYSPKGSLESHARSHEGNITQTTHLVATGTGGGSGTIAREAPMAQSANLGVASFANGGSGTFGEWIAMLHNAGGVLAMLKGTGGVADSAAGWMKWVDAKPSFAVVAESDPVKLATEAQVAYRAQPSVQAGGLGRERTRRLNLVSPGTPRVVLTAEAKRGRLVGAFLTEDPRASSADRAAAAELVETWTRASAKTSPRGAIVVMPEAEREGAGAGSALARSARAAGATSLVIAPGSSRTEHSTSMRSLQASLGYPEVEMARFSAAREVTQDAHVVFFSSARYQNLASLAFALRDDREPLLAVLASESTHADKLPEMVGVIDPAAAARRLVVGRTPKELVDKVMARLKLDKTKADGQREEKKSGLD